MKNTGAELADEIFQEKHFFLRIFIKNYIRFKIWSNIPYTKIIHTNTHIQIYIKFYYFQTIWIIKEKYLNSIYTQNI